MHITNLFKKKDTQYIVSQLTGNVIAKILLVFGGLFLADKYGPELFGSYNIFVSLVLMFTVIVSLRLENLIILNKGFNNIKSVFSFNILVILIITTILCILLWAVKALNFYAYTIPLGIVVLCITIALSSFNQTQQYFLTKYKQFRKISIATVLGAFITILTQAIFYFTGNTTYGLEIGFIVGIIAIAIYLLATTKKRIGFIDRSYINKAVKENPKLLGYTFPAESLNSIANNILPILMVFYFTTKEIGVYSLATKAVATPLILLSSSIANVYYQKSSKLFNTQQISQLKQYTKEIILVSIGVIFSYLVVLNTLGIYLLKTFLSNSWQQIGLFINILSFWILARSALNPIANLVLVLKKNHYSLFFNIYLILCNIIAIIIGGITNNFVTCLWVFSISTGIGYLAYLFITWRALNKYE